MATQHTPQDQRRPPPPSAAALAAIAPPQMSHEDFKVYMDRYFAANAGDAAQAPGQPAVGAAAGAAAVNAVSVKLPTFWLADPELWFHQVESVFRTRTPPVTRDGTMYDHVMSHLPSEVLTAVRHLIQLPHTTPNRYQLLKDTLNAAYGKTPANKMKELLE